MLTIFAVPKPFHGHIGVIQRNAIRSWKALRPECEVILCGNEAGTAEAAREFGARWLPNIECNEFGTPLLSSVFQEATAVASNRTVCYANCDIMLLSDFVSSLSKLNLGRFLVVGQRWDLDLESEWEFSESGAEAELLTLVRERGVLHPPAGSDYFAFSMGCGIERLPPFAVGRVAWDNWMLAHAHELRIPLIDASQAITAIHQNHGYNHVPKRRGEFYDGPESDANLRLLGATTARMTLSHAPFLLTPNGLRTRVPTRWQIYKGRLLTLKNRLAARMQVRSRAKRVVRGIVQKLREYWNVLPIGQLKYECPVCQGRFRRLLPSHGRYSIRGQMLDHSVENSQCPRCASGIRHRFVFKFLQGILRPSDKTVLHFAPEKGFYKFFKKRAGTEYVPCDVSPPSNSDWKQVDITDITLPDARFDVIVCVHVLEHIQDDRRAIAELFRVLKPGGHMVLAVPTYGPRTYEDNTLDEVGRERMFGIGDHKRLNGLDLADKLEAAGFQVRILSIDDVPGDYLDRSARSPHIDSDKYLFYCEKLAVAASVAA